MRFKISSRFDAPVIVRFEMSGAELTLDPGDFITIEWPAESDQFSGFVLGPIFGAFVIEDDEVVISEPGKGMPRAWNSGGEELAYVDATPL